MIPGFDFGDIGRTGFLDRYWQRRPLLLRGAIDPDRLQLPPEELAGLACEPEVESRLVRQQGPESWSLQHGPFEEADFAALPERDWTLLVQDVDKHLPEVARLLEAFDFIPDWRLDDIMISYAADGGGVGPHTDNYDVFLVQAAGRRRWRLSDADFTDEDLLPDCPLRVLRRFPVSEDLVLEPGDVLYLPPRVGHWGTALGECMTWSVGMRGPSDLELAAAWIAHLAERQRPHLRDHLAGEDDVPARLQASDLAAARELIAGIAPKQDAEFARWLGAFLTEPKPGFEIEPPEAAPDAATLAAWRTAGRVLLRHPWARLALVHLDERRLALCCQGEALTLPRALEPALERIAQHRRLPLDTLPAPADPTLLDTCLAELLSRGWLIPDD